MKKFVAILVAAMMMFALCACGEVNHPEGTYVFNEAMSVVGDMFDDEEIVNYSMNMKVGPLNEDGVGTIRWRADITTLEEPESYSDLTDEYTEFVTDAEAQYLKGEITLDEYMKLVTGGIEDYASGYVDSITKEPVEEVEHCIMLDGTYTIDANGVMTILPDEDSDFYYFVDDDDYETLEMQFADNSITFELKGFGDIYEFQFDKAPEA